MSVEARPKGSRIDRYELRDRVGEGGMGNVYRAVDTKIGRTVAVKILVPPDGRPLTDQLRERFLREVLAISRIDHPNVVKVHDYGFGEDGTPYMVMEYLDGQDFARVLRRTKEPFPIEQVADIMLEVCAALRACHEVSVVHRDLKPANIFLATTESGSGWQVKVVDFGVSKAPVDGDLTEHGQIVGTLQYLSPEQVNGKAEPASDQYALGVLLYTSLTRKLPYGGLKHVALLKAIDKGEFKKPREHRPEIPEALEAIILRAMHLSPAGRFESVYALGKRLWEFASPLGRETWKKFYIHSPVPTSVPRELSGGIPIALSQSLGEGQAPAGGAHSGNDEDAPAQTAMAHYQSTTVANQGTEGTLGSPSRHPPTLSDNIVTTPLSGYGIGLARSGDGESNGGRPLQDGTIQNPWRRQLMISAAGTLAVVIAGGIAWAIHRPEVHLIRPARVQQSGEQGAAIPSAGGIIAGPVTAPGSDLVRASFGQIPGQRPQASPPPSISPRGQAPATPLAAASQPTNPDGAPAAEGETAIPRPKRKRRVHVRHDVEMTPDGVPLLR